MEASIRSKWRKKPTVFFFLQRSHLLTLSLLLILFVFLFFISSPSPLTSSKLHLPSCRQSGGENFLWYAPHSGFSNQLSEFKNALLISSILNRTLVVPPVLDHHAVALGSCPKFRVLDANDIRFKVWEHVIDLIRSRRYVSMGDVIDLSTLESSSSVKTIDFRVFVLLWCGIDLELVCFPEKTDKTESSVYENLKQCGSLLSGLDGNVDKCLFAVQDDCRSTVWTYQQSHGEDGALDSFQPDEQLKLKKRISYVRRRRDVYKALGPDSEVSTINVLAFGSLFSAPYKGSESYIDIHRTPSNYRIQRLIEKTEYLPFVPEILGAGKEFALEIIRAPFICAQLRLLDGQFKNHWKATFLALENKIKLLKERGSLPIHVFLMTDLAEGNWSGTYLGHLGRDKESFKLYTVREDDDLVVQTAKRLVATEHGLKYKSFPNSVGSLNGIKNHCPHQVLPDILLYVQESVCSCASLGFVGTAGSTIAESIELMRKFGTCSQLKQLL